VEEDKKFHSKVNPATIAASSLLGAATGVRFGRKSLPKYEGEATAVGAIIGGLGALATGKIIQAKDYEDKAEHELKKTIKNYKKEGDSKMDKVAFYKDEILKIASLTSEEKTELKARKKDATHGMRKDVKKNHPLGKTMKQLLVAEAKGGAVGAGIGAIGSKVVGIPVSMGALGGATLGANVGVYGKGMYESHKQGKEMREWAKNRYKDDSPEVQKAGKNGGYFGLRKAEKIKYQQERDSNKKTAQEIVNEAWEMEK